MYFFPDVAIKRPFVFVDVSADKDLTLNINYRSRKMEEQSERRKERRLRYHWPVWFAEDFDEVLSQGQMVDVSSDGAAFTCYSDQSCPYPGQDVTARFSVPQFDPDNSFGLASFTRTGKVCRVDEINDYVRRVAMQFAEALPFKPGEQAETEIDTRERLKAVTI